MPRTFFLKCGGEARNPAKLLIDYLSIYIFISIYIYIYRVFSPCYSCKITTSLTPKMRDSPHLSPSLCKHPVFFCLSEPSNYVSAAPVLRLHYAVMSENEAVAQLLVSNGFLVFHITGQLEKGHGSVHWGFPPKKRGTCPLKSVSNVGQG